MLLKGTISGNYQIASTETSSLSWLYERGQNVKSEKCAQKSSISGSRQLFCNDRRRDWTRREQYLIFHMSPKILSFFFLFLFWFTRGLNSRTFWIGVRALPTKPCSWCESKGSLN
jgi:hypothetical protein